MYTSRPSKQHQKKGMQLMKKLINSQKRVKTMVYNNDGFNYQSQTSIHNFLNKSQDTQISKLSQQKLFSASKVNLKDMSYSIPQISKINKKPQFIMQNYVQILNKSRQRIYSHNQSYQTLQKSCKNSRREYKKLSEYHKKMNISLENLDHYVLNDRRKLVKIESVTQSFFKSQISSMDRQQSVSKLKNSSIMKKDRSYVKQNKFNKINESRFLKERKLQEDLKNMQVKLEQQKQRIKQIRKEFVDLLQEGKVKTKEYDEDLFQMQIKEKQIQDGIERYQRQNKQRKQTIQTLEKQLQELTLLVQTQKSTIEKQKRILTQQILNTQQINSTITRKIYHLKQQFLQIKQNDFQIKKKQQNNKQLLRQLIKQQDKVNKLKITKQMKIIEKKQQTREKLLDQLQLQDKKDIYDRLDKELNFIKEYYKISSNSKQFKRNIKKMTKFQTIIKQIKNFQQSPQYSQDIMNMYKRQLWDIGMPRFLAEEVMYIEAPQVRKLKNTIKQIDQKRKNLNQILKEKQRLVNSLSFKSQKLTQQIEQMKLDEQRRRQQQELASQIDWGF